MAQAPSPSGNSIDRPPRLPLIAFPANRADSRDQDSKLVNGYISREAQTEEAWIYKRPGRVASITNTAGTGLGIFRWQGDIYQVIGTTLWKNTTNVGAVNGGSFYQFSSTRGASPVLVLKNNTNAYTYSSGGGLVAISDPQYPAVTVPGIAYLDGTFYVMDAAGKIWGSDINDPNSWDPLNSIVAQISPDAGVAINTQLVYVIAFKEWSTEVFYDAANATGSPLASVAGSRVTYGCKHGLSVQKLDGSLLWVGTSENGSVNVMMMDQLAAKVVSTKPIERLLEKADFTSVYSWVHKEDGHKFYLITFKNSDLTLAFDLNEKIWHHWSDETTSGYVPLVGSSYNSSMQQLAQHESNGIAYIVDQDYTTDAGTTITTDIITPLFDGGIRSRIKSLFNIFIVGDQEPGSHLQIRYSDDDYQSWSGWRTLDLGQPMPEMRDEGSFYKRAYHFRHVSPTPMRLMAVELQMDIGSG